MLERWKRRAGWLKGETYALYLAYRDPRTPWYARVWVALVVGYAFSPIDLIPDMAIPGLGEIDDVVVLVLALKMFVDLSPTSIVREHLEDLFGKPRNARQPAEPATPTTIEGSYRVLDVPNSERRTQDR